MNGRHETFVKLTENMEKHSTQMLSILGRVADTISGWNV